MTMFHLVFPRRRGFLHWDELGCMARSLGFQEDVFQQNINYEINADEDGLKLKEIVSMLDLKLLYRPLHRTFNMHTAGWNMAVIRKAIKLLDHHALTFEELHNIRVSYEMYEAIDMKGLYLDQHILLRAIKMCGRFIAPMKLMHRIKHMKGSFDEKERIQLYEFLDLIMWCDFYQRFNPADMEYSEGMDQELFKLVDFERLLSHHDERVARQLNQQYLQEEWDFGRETLGSKSMFRDPPVNNDQRLRQTKFHRERYRHLKEQVGHSQRRVFQALAGYVRQRPISAPDLSMYCRTGDSDINTPTTAKQVYQSVQRRLKSAPSMNATTSAMDLTDRPPTRQYTRATTPVAVSAREKTEIDQKMEHLNFAITTLESRMEIHKEREMQIYIPHYLEKLANRPPPADEIIVNMEPEPEPAPKPKKQGLSEEAVKRLAYPPPRLPPSHARKCDARFRGWYDVRKKPGSHYVLVANTLEPSPVGSQLIKMRERLAKEVPQHHSDYIYRYTRKREISASSRPSSMGLGRDSRPITAPAAVELGVEPLNLAEAAGVGDEGEGVYLQPVQNGAVMPESGGVSSRAEVHMQRSESATVDHLMKMTNLYEAQLAGGGGATNLLPENISSDSRQVSLEREVAFGLEPLSVSTPMAKKQEQKVQGGEEDKPSLGQREPSVVDLYLPVPVSAHTAAPTNGSSSSSSKPKKIEMGQIGTVTLLESIKEADADEELSYTSTELSSEREDEPKVSRLGQLARDSIDGTPEERAKEDLESEETETGTETTSTARVTSAERRSILVRREAASTPYGYRPPRTPSPGKERRNVKYDENSLKKEVLTPDVTEGTSQSDSRTVSSPESPQRKLAAQQQTQQQQQQTQKHQQSQQQQQQQQQQQTQKQQQAQQQQQSSSESPSSKAKPGGDSGSPDSKISRGWDSPVKQQTSPSTKASKTSEPYNFPKEANFPLDSVHLGKKACTADNTSKDTAGPQTSTRGSGESRSPESGRKAEEKKKVLSPRNSVVQNGRSQGRTGSASTVSGMRLEVDLATPKTSPRLSPRGGQKTKKGKPQAPKYGKFVKRYEKDLPPYLKNRLLTAGTS